MAKVLSIFVYGKIKAIVYEHLLLVPTILHLGTPMTYFEALLYMHCYESEIHLS